MKILGGIFLMVVLIFSAYFGKNVPFSSQWPLYEALQLQHPLSLQLWELGLR